MGGLPPLSTPPPIPGTQIGRSEPFSEKERESSFVEILTSSFNQVNQLQKEADRAIQDLALGRSQDVAGTLILLEKARLSFQLLVQVRNKILEAYQEILRMPI